MSRHIIVAVSGGIDSLMAAVLLKEEGHTVSGIHFRTGYETLVQQSGEVISRIEEQIGMTVRTVDLSDRFASSVVDYFVSQYASGLTPNPCLVCNPVIKFGFLREMALEGGAQGFATGHYARIQCGADGRHHLLRGIDRSKDQSYFLSRLTRQQLAGTYFPLGGFTKTAIHRMAAERGIVAQSLDDSQDVCFIGKRPYTDFLRDRGNLPPQPGPIEDEEGNRLGSHNGLHRFTIGQRRGINCPAARPYYVKEIDHRRNRLIVAFEERLYRRRLTVSGINWIAAAPSASIQLAVRLRYRHTPAPATLQPLSPDAAAIRFDDPQKAVTPGQGAVFYQEERVLGGGWIEPAAKSGVQKNHVENGR